ncbi:hypothetical protein JKY72_03835 [Candidatus Gracilibacteria bacterium]|nr:hypothetical protein [Candidatus Gracilibacteria bacterium]
MQETLLTVFDQISNFIRPFLPFLWFSIVLYFIFPAALKQGLQAQLLISIKDPKKFEEDFLQKDNYKNPQIIRDIQQIKQIKKAKGLKLTTSKSPQIAEILIVTEHSGEHWFKLTSMLIGGKMKILSFDRFT